MENKKQEITGTNFNMHAISTAMDIPVCTSIEDIWPAAIHDADLQRLKP